MILFFISTAVLVIAVLALLLPVFSRTEQTSEPNRTDINVGIAKAQARDLRQRLEAGELSADDYADEKTRLEAGLARDIEKEESTVSANTKGKWLFWPMAAALPVSAGALYLILGTPLALDPAAYERPPEPVATQQQEVPDMQEIVVGIKQRVAENPNDARAWFMLGRAHMTLGEYPEAEDALRKAVAIDDSDVNYGIRLADAIALSQNRSLLGEPTEILKRALEVEPNHPQGLWLYGMALEEGGDPEQAIATWNKLLPQLNSDPQALGEVQRLIANAQAGLAVDSTGQSAVADNTAVDAAGIQVVVDVKSGLAADLDKGTPVFVYAKAVSGPPMPLAVVKRSLGDLPLTVTLTDAQAMIENMKISAFDQVIIGARISKSGNPIGQPGDLFSESGAVNTREQTTPVEVTISETTPE